jgi:hypothetical protein
MQLLPVSFGACPKKEKEKMCSLFQKKRKSDLSPTRKKPEFFAKKKKKET